MPNAIIVEDEQNAADLLETMICEIEPSITVVEKCSDLPSAIKAIRKLLPQIVFLDIELPVYSGIQLLDFLNPDEITFHLIFATAYNEYAVRAFEMSAAAYLMKPIQEDKLRIAINRIIKSPPLVNSEWLPALRENFRPGAARKIVVPVTSGFDIIATDDICYLKADGSYTYISLKNGTSLLVSKNLKYFEMILAGTENFLRIHRSIIANIKYARKIFRKDGGVLILEDKTELPIAEDKIPKILELIPHI